MTGKLAGVLDTDERNVKTRPQFSFEEYAISKFEEITFDRRGPCAICRKATLSAFRRNCRIIRSHFDCFSLLLFYEFMYHIDVDWKNQDEGIYDGGGSMMLSQLYDISLLLKYLSLDRNKCYICGVRSAYFKCASENCSNYLHSRCTEIGLIIVEIESGCAKKNNYRFLLCRVHVKEDEINLVKGRFLSKLLLTREYIKFQKDASALETPEKSPNKSTAETSSEGSNLLPGSYKSYGSAQRQFKGSRTASSYSGRALCPPKRLDIYSMVPKTSKKLSNSSVSPLLSSFNAKSSQYMQLVSSFMLDYNSIRKQNGQKNNRKLEWWQYDVLFTKISPDVLEESSNCEDGSISDLCDIIKFLDFDVSCSMLDLKRIPSDCELAIRNISNAVSLHLDPKLGTSKSLSTGDAETSNVSYSDDSTSQNSFKVNQVLSTDISESDNDRVFRLNLESRKPRFVLAHFDNKAAWFSCAFLNLLCGEHESGTFILEYFPLTLLEFEYCRRMLRSVYYLSHNSRKSLIPILSRGKEKMEIKNALDTGTTRISLSGYTWDEDPALYTIFAGKFANNMGEFSDFSSEDADTHGLNYMELYNLDIISDQCHKIHDALDNRSNANFVTKQSVALILALKAVNEALKRHKRQILEKIRVESTYSNARYENKLLVEQYKEASSYMHRWSHFRTAFQQCVESFSSSMVSALELDQKEDSVSDQRKEETDENQNVNDINEFCSVCLMAELSHKHILQQCGRCFVRVHHRCYGSYRPTPTDTTKVNTKQEETSQVWLCDPCEYEYNLNPKLDAKCNSAICCICCSTGGAMKRVMDNKFASKDGMETVFWVHLHCIVFLMPNVTCFDWYDLNMWDFEAVKFSSSDKCGICGVVGGYTIKCFETGCTLKFHPTCGWLGGMYVDYSPLHNSSMLPGMLKHSGCWNDIFPAICLRQLCIMHSVEKFGERIVNEQCRKRCHAYTHYLYQPDPYGRQKPRTKPLELPLRLTYSPVTITKHGAVKSPPKREAVIPVRDDHHKKVEILGHGFGHRRANSLTRPRLLETHSGFVSQSAPVPVVYGLCHSFVGDTPRYGITAITNYLSNNREFLKFVPRLQPISGMPYGKMKHPYTGTPMFAARSPVNATPVNHMAMHSNGYFIPESFRKSSSGVRFDGIQNMNMNASIGHPGVSNKAKSAFFRTTTQPV